MKSIKLTILLGLALAGLPYSGWCYAFESSAAFATWTDGNYIVSNDCWNTNHGAQTIWANSGSNWGVFSEQPSGNGVETYPHVEYNNVTDPVDSLPDITSSFDASSPSGSSYDLAFDIWLNGSSYEVMIWNQWVNAKPIAQSYNAQGQAVPTYTNVVIDGVTYNIYTGTGGSGPCMSFLRQSQTSSATIDISDILKWIPSTGWYSNPSLRSIQYGWEISSTTGQEDFTMNSYSVSVAGNGSVANGMYQIVNRNSGLALDVVGGETTNSTPVDQWPYHSGSNQQWLLNYLGNGEYQIIGVGSGKALDVYADGTGNGNEIDIYSSNGNNNQEWSLTATSDGYYRLTPANATGSCLDVKGSSTTEGALTELWTYNGGNSQQWTFQSP